MLTQVLTLVPLAVVMVTGPQILTAMILATDERRGPLTLRFLLGAIVGMAIVSGLAFLTGFTISNTFTLPNFVKWTVIALLALVMVATFVGRNGNTRTKAKETHRRQPNPFLLAILLLGVFPTDLLTNLAIGASLSEHPAPLGYLLLFIAVTCVLLLIPLAIVAILGERAHGVLDSLSEFIKRYTWVLTEVICFGLIVFFYQH